jgi:hypothetical protein
VPDLPSRNLGIRGGDKPVNNKEKFIRDEHEESLDIEQLSVKRHIVERVVTKPSLRKSDIAMHGHDRVAIRHFDPGVAFPCHEFFGRE